VCFKQWYGDGPDATGKMQSWTTTDAEAPAKAGWLMGVGLLKNVTTGLAGQPVALRSMINPGKAYADPVFGNDPQPADMAALVPPNDPKAQRDNGGVHINSGIPNRAFYRLARSLDDDGIDPFAFMTAGKIWYNAFLRNGGLRPFSTFQDAANVTFNVAGAIFPGGPHQDHVRDAWADVGIAVAANSTILAGFVF
jgi:Zn-dependent metalloprotease